MDFVGRGEGRGSLLEHLLGLSAQWLGCLPQGGCRESSGEAGYPQEPQHELKGQEGTPLEPLFRKRAGQSHGTDGCRGCLSKGRRAASRSRGSGISGER